MSGIKTTRRMNGPLADRITQVIQDVVDKAEKTSEWLTLTIEIQIQAGKFKSLRQVTNQVWMPDGANGQVLTEKPVET